MKKLVAIVLLSAGFASQVVPSDNNYPNCPPCNLPTPSPKEKSNNVSPANTPRNNDSDNK